jgi:hypothetical protein
MPEFNQRSCASSCHSGSMSRSGGRFGLRDESEASGVSCRRQQVEPPLRAARAGLSIGSGQVPSATTRPRCMTVRTEDAELKLGATKAKCPADRPALRLTSLIHGSSMGLREGFAWARHGLSTFNPLEENKRPNQCGNFFLQSGRCCLRAHENPGSGAMLLQTPCDSLAASGQGSAA